MKKKEENPADMHIASNMTKVFFSKPLVTLSCFKFFI
jgi:hypothetical protein